MKYEEEYELTCHDVDANNNLRPSMILRTMQNSADHQMRDRKPTYYELFMEGKPLILTRISIEIFEQIHQYDVVTAKTWRCPAKAATLIRCYTLEREGKIMARAYSTWAIANRKTGKLCKVNEIDISNFEEDEPLKLNIPTRFRLPSDLKLEKIATRKVGFSDVDMNMHMNNSNYPDIICNYIPEIENKELTSINIRYMTEAALGTDMDIYMAKGPVVEQDLKAEETYYFESRVGSDINIEAEIGVRKTEKHFNE